MANTVYNTIAVEYNEPLNRLERVSSEAITPGHLLAISAGALIKHAVANGATPSKLIALETQTPDASTTAQIDIDYASGDIVYHAQGEQGNVFNMWLKAGEATTIGETYLRSAGDGTLQALGTPDATTIAEAIVGIAWQTVTGGAAAKRCLVRIV